MSFNWKTYSIPIIIHRRGDGRDSLVAYRNLERRLRESRLRMKKEFEATVTGKTQYHHGDPIYPIW